MIDLGLAGLLVLGLIVVAVWVFGRLARAHRAARPAGRPDDREPAGGEAALSPAQEVQGVPAGPSPELGRVGEELAEREGHRGLGEQPDEQPRVAEELAEREARQKSR